MPSRDPAMSGSVGVPRLERPRDREGSVEAERRSLNRQVGVFLAESEHLAFTRAEAAARLGVSVDFFEEHVTPEIRVVRRGRRLLIPAAELVDWLWRSAS